MIGVGRKRWDEGDGGEMMNGWRRERERERERACMCRKLRRPGDDSFSCPG
jgi:hypothetical protein